MPISFQSARPRGARLNGRIAGGNDSTFQSARPRGARPVAHLECRPSTQFQSARPRGARRTAWTRRCATTSRFNPRAHAGRDPCAWRSGLGDVVVSIRAPTRGATPTPHSKTIQKRVSIRAPTRGATRHIGEGGEARAVSIRAPTRGATRCVADPRRRRSTFQSARPRGARRTSNSRTTWMRCFNPRAHAGRDPRPRGKTTASPGFNPRAHAGRDRSDVFALVGEVPVSIRAPTRGATVAAAALAYFGDVFQSARPRGARRDQPLRRARRRVVSIRAPTRGATRSLQRVPARTWCFNPRAHAGRDAARNARGCNCPSFNPRAHAGRDAAATCPTTPSRCFNPRAHAGRDSRRPRLGRSRSGFNPRAHAGRDWDEITARISKGEFQSARPRGARHVVVDRRQVAVRVSIRAPTRGATRSTASRLGEPSSFNPRAHAGRDPVAARRLRRNTSFNPRAHAGRDPLYFCGSGRGRVSIRAPTRGATSWPARSIPPSSGFNPRAHAGRDRATAPVLTVDGLFQSARPRGARQ